MLRKKKKGVDGWPASRLARPALGWALPSPGSSHGSSQGWLLLLLLLYAVAAAGWLGSSHCNGCCPAARGYKKKKKKGKERKEKEKKRKDKRKEIDGKNDWWIEKRMELEGKL